MTTFKVGKDETYGDYNLPPGIEADWVAYWYEVGDYCGSGEAVAKLTDGRLMEGYLGHCSCYGPWEGGWNGESCWDDPVTIERWLEKNPRSDNALDDQQTEALHDQVRKLVGG